MTLGIEPQFVGWRERAKCRGHDVAEFDVDEMRPRSFAARQRRAHESCLGCPVQIECLSWALAGKAGGFTWGGVAIPSPWRKSYKRALALARRRLDDLQGGFDPAQPTPYQRRPDDETEE